MKKKIVKSRYNHNTMKIFNKQKKKLVKTKYLKMQRTTSDAIPRPGEASSSSPILRNTQTAMGAMQPIKKF